MAEQKKECDMKPMKPYTINDVEKDIQYPSLCTPKIDGIRCVTKGGGAPKAYSLKPIPNLHIQSELEKYGVPGMDGELWVVGAKTFGDSSGPIMRMRGEPDFVYFVFDRYDQVGGYVDRVVSLDALPRPRPPWLRLIKPAKVMDAKGFMSYWNKCVDDGWEGVIARNDTSYKFGLSTKKENGMGKYKHFQDDEAEVIGFKEMCTNTNPKITNLHGRSERGSSKAGKVPNGHMGKWLCRDLKTNIEFSCGTMLGVKIGQRKEFWDNKHMYLGGIIKYKHQPSGETAKPRFPVFLGFRHKDDM